MSTGTSTSVVRSTVIDTWKWLWPDLLMRIIPLGVIPLLYIALLHQPLAYLGLVWDNVPLQLLAGTVVGLLMTAFASIYRMYIVGPWFRWPTRNDQILQTFFYLFINGPIEEFFFRGFILTMVAQWSSSLLLGWLVSTAIYTLYHRLGKWSWRSVGGVGLAGIVFSTLYLVLPGPRSLLAVVIVHGLTTCGFLSWGDEIMYRRWKKLNSRKSEG